MTRPLWIYFSFALAVAGNLAAADKSATIRSNGWEATFSQPTMRYGHAVLGDTPEWGRLCLIGPDAKSCVTLPQRKVFEDIAPRLADVDDDGRLEAIVVESDAQYGAALAIYRLDSNGLLARTATPPIGTAFRWLAPVGIADLDGDGRVEIAYVDRPHLARVLRVWRYVEGQLVAVASKPGLSNHRIGDGFIVGGLRRCEGEPIWMITANADWSKVVATKFDGGRLVSESLGPLGDDADFDKAMQCS